MKRNIMSYINKLQAYRTAIKNLHWDSNSLSEHKLLDEIDSKVNEYQDEIAEVAQGVYGIIKMNELRPRRYKITSSKKMLSDMVGDTANFYGTIKRSKDCIGLRSVMESFLGDLNKFTYLLDICLKEDVMARFMGREKLEEEIVCAQVKKIIKEKIEREKLIQQLTEEVKQKLMH